MRVLSSQLNRGNEFESPEFHELKGVFRALPVLLKHFPTLMVGKHGGHCFLVGADGLGQVLSMRIGPTFSGSRVFRLSDDRTDFPEPSRRRIATHRSLLTLSSETGTFGVVSG